MTTLPNMADTNPYAPSLVPQPQQDFAEAGVGLWRDGDLVVMHRDAAWPAVCIRTGEPAVGWFPTKISRMAPGSWLRSETIRFRIPVGRRWHWLTTRLRVGLLTAGLISLGALVTSAFYFDRFPNSLSLSIALGGGVTSIALILTSSGLAELVTLRRDRGNYLWLTGPSEKFLEQLPVWPFHRSP